MALTKHYVYNDVHIHVILESNLRNARKGKTQDYLLLFFECKFSRKFHTVGLTDRPT